MFMKFSNTNVLQYSTAMGLLSLNTISHQTQEFPPIFLGLIQLSWIRLWLGSNIRSFSSSSVPSKLCWNSIKPPTESISLSLDGDTCSNRICIIPRKAELWGGLRCSVAHLCLKSSVPSSSFPFHMAFCHLFQKGRTASLARSTMLSWLLCWIMRCGVYLKLH